jgi:hypothetical protein
LQELANDLLPTGEVVVFASTLISVFFLILELRPVDFDMVNSLDVPSETQVNLLYFPVLQEDSTPDACEDTIGEGVLREPQPGDDSGDGGECEEDDVGLDKCEVECNLHR